MITVIDALVYSVNGSMAYELTYSEGSKIRTIESKDRMITTECFINNAWKQTQKPYVIKYSKQRNAEKIKASVLKFLGK